VYHCAGWSVYDGTCYRLYEERLTWNAAVEFCRAESAHLADVTSRAHLDWLRGFAKHNKFWIGELLSRYSELGQSKGGGGDDRPL